MAHLYSAGFPDIVDCSGQVAEVLDPTEPVPFDPQREETDQLQGNLLVFQFLAFSRWGPPCWVTSGCSVSSNCQQQHILLNVVAVVIKIRIDKACMLW